MKFEYNEELSGVVLHYEPLTGMEEMQARLGVDWDDAGRLLRYAADDVPGYLRIRIGHLDEKLSLLVKKVFHLDWLIKLSLAVMPILRFPAESLTSCKMF